jgi:tetratricopeptide (TPR) repeat protein
MKEDKYLMTYHRRYLLVLLILAFLCSCSQTPQQRAKDATVLIVAGNADGTVGSGSGFFVGRDKIVTNIHVVDSARMVFAVGTKRVYNVEKVIGYNPSFDVVILKVSGKGKPLELSDGQINEPIFVVGYPGGGYGVTKGRIHGIRNSDRQLWLTVEGFPKNKGDFVLVDGNSGGPILNSEWQVIGIAVSSGEVFSFASASSILNAMLDLPSEEDLSDWQKKDPILAYVYKAWGDKKLDSRDYNSAIKGFCTAIELYRHADAYDKRGQAKGNLGRHQEAIQDYNEAIKLIPDDFTVHYNRGIDKLKDGDSVGAIQDFNKTLELNPDHAEAYRNRGIAKLRKSDPNYGEAIEDYIQAIRINPKNASIYYNLGNANLNKGNYDRAIENYTRAIKLNLKDTESYVNRGVAKTKKSVPNYEGAIQDYTETIKLKEDYAAAYYNRGNANKVLGKDENAKLDYAKAYYYWGKAHSNSDNYQEAIKHLNKSIALNSDYAAYYARGNAKQKGGDYEGAIRDYREVINRKPDYAEAYFSLGVVHIHLDNRKVAIGHFQKAIKRKPELAEAYYNLGATRYHFGDYKVAIDHFDKAIKLKEPAIYAKAYKARGDAKKALEDADAKWDFFVAHYHWGNEAYKRAQYQEAIKNFDTTLKLVPEYDVAYGARGNAKAALWKFKVDLGDLGDAQNLYEEAIKDYNEAIRLGKGNAVADYYRNRGWTEVLHGNIRDYNGAIEEYEVAIQDFTKAINQFTEAIKRESDTQKIEDIKSKLANAYSDRAKALCLFGYAKANQGQPREARKQYNLALEGFKKACELDSDNASYYKGLGLANAALGKAKAVIETFEKAKELDLNVEK